MTTRVARILSIDGGGIRGLIPAQILKSLGLRGEQFHMISGTSTGGIIACGMASGLTADTLVDFYTKRGPAIFSNSLGALAGAFGDMYAAAPLEAALKEAFGTKTLSQVDRADLLITTYEIEKRVPWLFKSWRARGIDETNPKGADFRLVDVARATSAAPTYFTPTKIRARDGSTIACIDGGVYANNPAMCAYVAARRLYPEAEEFVICSIGTGQMVKPFKYDDAVNWGLAGWVRPLLDIMFDGVASTTDYELDQLPGISHIRLQASLEHASEALDDAEPGHLADLIRTGQETIAKNLPSVQALRAKLAEPMATREALGYPKPGAATRSGSMRPALVSRRPVALVAKAQPAISAPASPPTTPAAVFPLGLGAIGGLVAGPVGLLGGVAAGLAVAIRKLTK